MDKKLFMNHVSTLFFRTSSKEIKPGTRFKQLREWNILLAVSCRNGKRRISGRIE